MKRFVIMIAALMLVMALAGCEKDPPIINDTPPDIFPGDSYTTVIQV